MGWEEIAQLIITIGLPAVEKLISNIENKVPVTLAEFQALRDEASRTAQDRIKAMAVQAGMTLNDPKVIALLALAQGPPSLVSGPNPQAP
jgi:hypothetical protein